jgi:hypothetical protein
VELPFLEGKFSFQRRFPERAEDDLALRRPRVALGFFGIAGEVVDERRVLDREDRLEACFRDVEPERVEVDAGLRIGLDLQCARRFEDPFQGKPHLHVEERLAFVVQIHDHLARQREAAGQRRARGIFFRRAAADLLRFVGRAFVTDADRHQQRLLAFVGHVRARVQRVVERDLEILQSAVSGELDRFGFEVPAAENDVADRRVQQLEVDGRALTGVSACRR